VDVAAIEREVWANVDAATEEALSMPMPDPATLTEGVYCTSDPPTVGRGLARWSGFRA
jgi:hypothetical protein